MANIGNVSPAEVLIAAAVGFLLLCLWRIFIAKGGHRSCVPTNWPIIGMLPCVLKNAHRIHDFATDVLAETEGTFEFKGPIFGNMDMVITNDPANVHHMLGKNFSNYHKGDGFKKIFDILGDGIFNADSQLWDFHRKTTLALFNHSKFPNLLQKTLWDKVEKGLIPVLNQMADAKMEFDLQDIFQRFTFDTICRLVLSYDPGSLSFDLPYIPCGKAFKDAEEAVLHRHLLPESCWKLQKWLQIGKEKQLSKAWEAIDDFLYPCVVPNESKEAKDQDFDFLKAFSEESQDKLGASGDGLKTFLRDTTLNLMLAGRDTTSTALSWFFWLLSRNPSVETKICEEIKNKLLVTEYDCNKNWRLFTTEELRKLVYLHGALSEALRLYPPVALQHISPIGPDILPSGHKVDQNTRIVLSYYSMGRMETIWGKDCMEFKPERWISERGGIKHEPSYKFPVFHAGPRTCLGKDMSFIQMKMVATTIISNFNVQVDKSHPICPSDSVVLQMKNGLKVVLTKRN